ncbi:Helicase (DNA) B, partial [Caligus rogercresseyi]
LKPEVPLEGGESKEECSIVLYCCSHGKAASVIRTRIQCKAYTIHQIISSHKKFLTEPSNTWKYACVKVLVVDECSMVGITVRYVMSFVF